MDPAKSSLKNNQVKSSKSVKDQRQKIDRHPLLKNILDDLCSRFVLNCPEEERTSFERICFQLELAHWFYEDEYRQEDSTLPKFNTKEFVQTVFHHCPLLTPYASQVDSILAEWVDYKFKVPVCGAILLPPELDQVLLVRGFGSRSTWGFPKGKINKDESPIDCCAREIYEEIGVNVRNLINEKDQIEIIAGEQKVNLYIIPNISKDVKFETQTKGEISEIAWHDINTLPSSYQAAKEQSKNNPNKYYMITAFIPKLKRWIRNYKKQKTKKQQNCEVTVPSPFKKVKERTDLNSFSPQHPFKFSEVESSENMTSLPPIIVDVGSNRPITTPRSSKGIKKTSVVIPKTTLAMCSNASSQVSALPHPFLSFRLDTKPLIACLQFDR